MFHFCLIILTGIEDKEHYALASLLDEHAGDLLQFEGINRRGKAAAVFPFTHAAMPTCDNRDNRMIQARFSSTSNNFREPVGDP